MFSNEDITAKGSDNLQFAVQQGASSAVKKIISEYWAVVVVVIIIFGWILHTIYDLNGRVCGLEAKIEMLTREK